MKKNEKKIQIINDAKDTFIENGLFNTAMNNIADKAGITRRTLYRYFDTKEDIAYEVTILLINQWNEFQMDTFNSLNGKGIYQLEDFLKKLISYMENKKDIMRYLGEFDFYFKDGTVQEPSTESIQKFNSIILESDNLLETIIKKGIEDKSIKDDIDVHLTIATISNVLWGFAQRVAIRENAIKVETGFTGLELIKHQIELYITALRK